MTEVVGDDRALMRAVVLLHRQREPAEYVLSVATEVVDRAGDDLRAGLALEAVFPEGVPKFRPRGASAAV
ncbi:MAG: hypothetical protein ACJ736_16015 [Streptomyces sp.]